MSEKKYIVKIEGQEFEVAEEIGTLPDDELKHGLAVVFPGAAHSNVDRAEKDGVVTITVVKLAGGKGGRRKGRKKGALEYLLSCKNRRNPAVELYLELHGRTAGEMDPRQLIGMAEEIEEAIGDGQRQQGQMVSARLRLARTAARDGTAFVPLGF